MGIRQLSIFIENKKGRLAKIAKIISSAGIDIRAISVADTSGFGILRIIVDDPDRAKNVLQKSNIIVSVTDVIAVEIKDKSGEFYRVMSILSDNDIGVEYMYAFISREKNKAFIILKIENEDKAVEVLKNNDVCLLNKNQIQ